MNIHVYTITHNEAVIIPYFLRHYETFATHIFVWDRSDDGTREMLQAHPLVTVFDQQCIGLDDLYFTTCFMQYRQLSRGLADWCICVGSDEFVYHPNIVQRLTRIDADKVQLEGFTMYSTKLPTTHGQIYDEIKYGYPDIWSTKTILFRPQSEMSWKPGLHVEDSGDHPARHTDIKLLHYRYLGADYFLERNRRNYAQWQAAGEAVEFDVNRKHNLPDGTRGNPYQWYEENRAKLVKVVECQTLY